MPNPYFRFKQFTIRHDRSAMKVGTDGVLLGAWAGKGMAAQNADCTNNAKMKILDIGTGTGLLALMLAQRFPSAQIVGIDIDKESLLQAQENVNASPFSNRIFIKEQDFSSFNKSSSKYNLIVSNPPFYEEDTLSGNDARDAARHTHALPFEALIGNTEKLLSDEGQFCVIIPFQSAAGFISMCAQHRLFLQRRLDVKSSERKPYKRSLLTFGHSIKEAEYDTLQLYSSGNNRSEDYAQLTQDFYL